MYKKILFRSTLAAPLLAGCMLGCSLASAGATPLASPPPTAGASHQRSELSSKVATLSKPSVAPSPTTTSSKVKAQLELNPKPLGAPGTWKMKLWEPFNEAKLNTKLWTPYWFKNGTVQNNVHSYSSNVWLSDGRLNLRLASGTSGATVSANPNDYVVGHVGFQHTYGFTQYRIFVPGKGPKINDWFAVWETGQNWPTTGENDIFEAGAYPSYHLHYGTPSNPLAKGATVPGNWTGWHTVGADWEPGSITYYYDGKVVGKVTGSAVTHSPLYPLMNMGAGYPGGAAHPGDVLKVEYVRIWQHS